MKDKVQVHGKRCGFRAEIKVKQESVQMVNHFAHVGSQITTNGRCSSVIRCRTALACCRLDDLRNFRESILLATKKEVLRICVLSVLLKACKTCTLRKEYRHRL